ncbi:DUF2099 family protein [Candidatus Fermentibacteria bacterium]|nr:DUF2099 family protein [Candidatus Fermentibacteria bacterium]
MNGSVPGEGSGGSNLKARVDRFVRLARRTYPRGDLHVTRLCNTMVAVRKGRVVLQEARAPSWCPVSARFSHLGLTGHLAEKRRRWGMFGKDRKVDSLRTAIPFGASEILMRAIESGAIDAAIVVCEGAGSVICTSARTVQGIGARMNGVFYTRPITGVIESLRAEGCLVSFPSSSEIDQAGALETALDEDFERVAVTVAGNHSSLVSQLRDLGRNAGVEVTLLSLCNTGVSTAEAGRLSGADMVWACAARPDIMRLVTSGAPVQLGVRSPVFCRTERAMRLIEPSLSGGVELRESSPASLLIGTLSEMERGREGMFGPVRIRARRLSSLPVCERGEGT